MTTTEAASETALLTAADLLRLDAEGVRGELVRGELCETMPAGQRHGKIVANLAIELGGFVKRERLGTVVCSDSGVWLERDPDTVREPDLAFTSVQRLPLGAEADGYAEVVPDLVVEVASPTDSRRSAHDKARMWLSHGVRLVWVVHPRRRAVDVHRPDRPVETIIGSGALDGFDVLAGFTCPLSEIFGPESQPPGA
ncbi:MAG: Uma2 family endonuclease [bacterium]|nr:Uma2 family endonuclease [bacterium]MDE0669008.1 Uma2 family endonuclease [bacterium]MXZ30117.1 Uma2 family endonuclease [Acidimicrobiia bacterium]MYB25397.1 Uma2 family endonuclease [Acidimicrobiia bacterium]MYE66738.1 Uma2 family endonuclease [Acidimicrobiia bacterium]